MQRIILIVLISAAVFGAAGVVVGRVTADGEAANDKSVVIQPASDAEARARGFAAVLARYIETKGNGGTKYRVASLRDIGGGLWFTRLAATSGDPICAVIDTDSFRMNEDSVSGAGGVSCDFKGLGAARER